MKRLLSALAMTALSLQYPLAADFGGDVAFLKQHTEVVLLQSKDGKAKVALVPAWQGRVMTSTSGGDSGLSYGWLNRELIASGKTVPHINVFGGEDRFWLGPEGGQYSIFFSKGAAFDLEHWFTPAAIDTVAYPVKSKSATKAAFQTRFGLTNYSGTTFDLQVDREVRLLTEAQARKHLGLKKGGSLELVAFETDNKVTNLGKQAWKKDTGLLSIWILGMFNPSASATIVVPIRGGSEAQLGKKVTSDYFGEVPSDRLKVTEDTVFFSADGQYRSKIGISPRRSKAVLGSYDAANKALTILQFSQPAGVTDYVNSLWKLQDNPYGGDASNAYNDGPPSPGAKPLGPFYELESSSPAAALAPGKSLSHVHRTIHARGSESELDPVARELLGVSLQEIKAALKGS